MKVLIVEEALEGLHGHYFQYIRDMVQSGRQAGNEIDILAHVNACPEVKDILGGQPVLRRSTHHAQPPMSKIQRFRKIHEHGVDLYQDVMSWLEKSGRSYDVTIFPTVRVDHLGALKRLAKPGHATALGQLITLIIESPGALQDDGSYRFPPANWPYRALLWLLGKSSSNARLTFAAESHGIARQLERFSEIPFMYLPHVTEMPPDIVRKALPKDEKAVATFGTFGFTRYDKGLDVMQSALHRLPYEQRSNMHFVMQWTGDYSLPDGTQIVKDPELQKSPGIEYIGRFSDSEDYYRWLSKIDGIVLPYRKDFYREKMSRVAVDSALLGLPAVYPKGTWLEEEFFCDYGAGVSFDAENVESLAAAILELRRRLPELTALAMERKNKTKADFCSRRFFKMIEKSLSDKKARA